MSKVIELKCFLWDLGPLALMQECNKRVLKLYPRLQV